MKKAHCPTCNRAFDPEKSQSMPFCSPRCREVDLGRWLDETNAIPADPETAAEEEDADREER